MVAITACSNPPAGPLNKFADSVVVRIADLQDRRHIDSLQLFLNDPNPQYRKEAVLAFASVQETNDIDRIGKLLLMDSDADVRGAAAFALGQLSHPSAERLLLGALVKEKIPQNTRTILEAYGKTTTRWKLETDPFIDDTLKTEGLAWSLYRASLREKTHEDATSVGQRLLASTFSRSTRLGAAHFFARGAAHFTGAEAALIAAATKDEYAEVRMAAATALGKIRTDSCLAALQYILAEEKDERVTVNAIRALRHMPFDKIETLLYTSLRHPGLHARITASEVVRDMVPADRWIEASSQINLAKDWQVIANLYDGVLRAGQHKDLAAEIEEQYRKERNPFARAALLGALKHYPPALHFVYSEMQVADTAVVRTAAAMTLVAMNRSAKLPRDSRKEFAEIYAASIRAESDPAVIGIFAAALTDSTLGFRSEIRDHSFLKEARSRLQLPRHIEAVEPLEAAIAYFEGRKPPPLQKAFNHPIDWEMVKRIPPDMTATIKTTRGNMRLRLFVEEAPGSVANFINLARSHYYDAKAVHRVVPNFVIQAGCDRGDGWGSKGYSLRSEFSQRRYTTGSVGMASAGKDTEGTQWFITHSPTPHLDGRYTIFGELMDGIKALDYIQIGDQIVDVDLGDFMDR